MEIKIDYTFTILVPLACLLEEMHMYILFLIVHASSPDIDCRCVLQQQMDSNVTLSTPGGTKTRNSLKYCDVLYMDLYCLQCIVHVVIL